MEIQIPEKLKKCNFVLLGGDDGKKPFEKGWQRKVHQINDINLQQHLAGGKNYGIRCGATSPVIINGLSHPLLVLDFDNQKLQDELIPKLPKTFTVKTGGKGMFHLYFASDNDKSFKILDQELSTLCDVQGEGKQVVAPGSINPKTGRTYEVTEDIPIAFISYAELEAMLRPYDTSPKNIEKPKKQYIPSGLSNDVVEKILSSVSLKQCLEEIGVDTSKNPTACPFHASAGGKCLGFNDVTANCFHCSNSFNAYSLIRKAKNFNDRQTFEWFAEKAGMMDELRKSRKDFVEKEKKEKLHKIYKQIEIDEEEDYKPEIVMPGLGKLISHFDLEIAEILEAKKTLFYRIDSKEIVEVGKIRLKKGGEETYTGFSTVKPNRLITLIEKYIIPGIEIYNENSHNWDFKKKSIGSELANTLLCSEILQQALPKVNRIFTIPIPIFYEGKLTFPKRGYDERFNSWLPHNAPAIKDPNMSLEEAKKIIELLLSEFCFQSLQDRTHAISALLTPYLRGLFTAFNVRTPVFFYLANRERAGKDYLAGITGILYEGHALEESPVSSGENNKISNNNEELRKKILAALIGGRKRMHFSNNKGFIDNAIFEAIITAEKYADRLLGKSEILTFENELDFSLSGNTGISFTPDLANRCRFVRLFLDIEDANARNFKNPNLHYWVKENRELILSALFALVRHWIEQGMKPGQIPFSSFPQWASVCGGIMEAAGYDNPCMHDKEIALLGGDIETEDMKQLFILAYSRFGNQWVTKQQIKDLVINDESELFGYLNFNDRGDQIKFANKIIKFVGRVLHDIKLVVKDSTTRSSRQEYMFTRDSPATQTKISAKNGNLGNLGNLGTLENPVSNKIVKEVPLITNIANITKNTPKPGYEEVFDMPEAIDLNDLEVPEEEESNEKPYE